MVDILVKIVIESWLVLGQMAAYLLFGFLVAGFLSVLFSPEWIERHLGHKGFGPVVKASLLGVPLPLCSCGVIPVSASFRRHGASRAATISFLLSTPQTGVDSIAITYALLGPLFAVFRPIAAFITGLVGGGLVQIFGEQNNKETPGHTNSSVCTEACCADKERRNIFSRALSYGFITLPRDIGGALLLGVLIAGALATILSPNQWQAYLGGGVVSILILMALGVPIYVCASASVPIAAGLIHLGASPGAALAFLIAGPATNAATVATTWKLLGRRTAVLYLLTVAVSAVGCGLSLDWLFSALGSTVPQLQVDAHTHGLFFDVFSAFWAVILLAVIAFSYLHQPRKETNMEIDNTDK
ncbi:MAG: SO_0444 family Cu/Zn efflux transporter [Thermoguttaceae bacterium]